MAMMEMRHVEPFEDATPLLSEPKVLREKAEADGLLFFQGLLDPVKVNALRAQILQLCDLHGWVEEGTSIGKGIANGEAMVCESLSLIHI